jgi:tRNA G18 (ribose-2'-O)-methylase SpoU
MTANSLPIHLVLDNIRMPDNLGALLRVAAAVGCKQVPT